MPLVTGASRLSHIIKRRHGVRSRYYSASASSSEWYVEVGASVTMYFVGPPENIGIGSVSPTYSQFILYSGLANVALKYGGWHYGVYSTVNSFKDVLLLNMWSSEWTGLTISLSIGERYFICAGNVTREYIYLDISSALSPRKNKHVVLPRLLPVFLL